MPSDSTPVKPWDPSTTGGTPEELERGERRGANALNPPVPLADWCAALATEGAAGVQAATVPPFPARGKKSVTFFKNDVNNV